MSSPVGPWARRSAIGLPHGKRRYSSRSFRTASAWASRNASEVSLRRAAIDPRSAQRAANDDRPVTQRTFRGLGQDTRLCAASAKRDKAAARRYFERAIAQNGLPETVTIDKSGANLAGLNAINAERETPIKIRQSKYLNNVVEQDHRAIKRVVRPMLGFKRFRCARIIVSGIELMHMIAKGQMLASTGPERSVAAQFYDLSM